MARRSNISRQTRAVLAALLEQPREWHYGYDLMERTGLASGTLYPMLIRLCDQGNLEARWVPSPHEGRPPRHAYCLTPSGLVLARDNPPGNARTPLQAKGFAT
ncbi:PadR family transcriptional regulator [Altererythrobacter confluentis]|uniref:PadR family transcriptional regulator n=1 Tax=Allopontixanthobacter confluentis TaxID=1849021 RepID=A0A6L7GC55_9SPHN|nr:PadR family transcriptional regulator [Allopontixanthobacter confluentis]MXP13632.1 PadR family transcriptional regulator [Allopontixanthobacter confluentis]